MFMVDVSAHEDGLLEDEKIRSRWFAVRRLSSSLDDLALNGMCKIALQVNLFISHWTVGS